MKFFFVFLLGTIAVSYMLPQVVVAQCEFGEFEVSLPGAFNKGSSVCDAAEQGQNKSPLVKLLNQISLFVLAGIVSIAIIIIVAAGYVYMTAGGNAGRVELSKSLIGSALLGIILALMAFLLLNRISPQFASEVKDPLLKIK